MKRAIPIVAALALLAFGSGVASADQAQRPQRVQAQIDALTAAGAKIVKVTRSEYVKTSGTAGPSRSLVATQPRAAQAQAQGYPSGCGLWVIVYRDGNIIHNSSTTSCLTPVDEIQMLGGIAWSRWFGWDELYQYEDGNFGSDYLNINLWVDCSGTGTHDYQGVTNGYVEIAGNEYHASAYDEIDRIECG